MRAEHPPGVFGQEGFAFDNEGPAHRVWLEPFALAADLVTNGDWIAFIQDGGYRDPRLWLSDGWATVQAERWERPLYWHADGDDWRAKKAVTIAGPAASGPVSGFEAKDAPASAALAVCQAD